MGNVSHDTVIQQNWNHPKDLCLLWLTFYLLYLYWNTQVSFPTVISQPTPFLILSYSPSPTPLIHFSVSLSLSPIYSLLCFTCLRFIQKEIDLDDWHHWINAFEWTLFLTLLTILERKKVSLEWAAHLLANTGLGLKCENVTSTNGYNDGT
jgi:hypothetical protein